MSTDTSLLVQVTAGALFSEARPHQQGLGVCGGMKNSGTASTEVKFMKRAVLFCERDHFQAMAESVSMRQS